MSAFVYNDTNAFQLIYSLTVVVFFTNLDKYLLEPQR